MYKYILTGDTTKLWVIQREDCRTPRRWRDEGGSEQVHAFSARPGLEVEPSSGFGWLAGRQPAIQSGNAQWGRKLCYEISLWREAPDLGLVYGAFKRQVGQGFAALGRLLWCVIHKPQSAAEFPCGMFDGRLRFHQYELGEREDSWLIFKALPTFLEGTSDELFDCLRGALLPMVHSPFMQTLLEMDMVTLEDFYRFGPQRNYELRQQHNLSHWLIGQEQLDDLLAHGAVCRHPRTD